ncbi:MAG: 8-oxoguanine deaminase [Oceanospirillaceae bacterium]|nr:8-oxoguanine deaminase [Oceanospirillaceae bacterium]HCI02627.1 8-oxoguanine deaminase [Oceanospirillaceae bacterium]
MTKAKRIWLKNPQAILANQAEHGLVVENGIIAELIGTGQEPSKACDSIIDASQWVVIPGLINGHHHFYQTLTRALPQALNKPLFNWLKSLYPVWAGLEPEMVYESTRLALAELLLSGCTTAADHHYLFPQGITDAMDIQAQAAGEMGLRMTMTRGSMSLSQDDGGLPPASTVQTESAIMADSERVIQRYHDVSPGSMLQVALAPCSPFSVTPELMRETAKLAAEKQVMLHTHLAETIDEENFCLQRFGMRTIDYLDSVNWLNDRTWLAHGIHFNDDEIARLGAAGTGICHCPTSNMMLASGMAPVRDLEAAGSPVGLGVDGSASNDGSNMMQEVRQALYLQRLKYGADVSHFDAFRWATEGSAKMLGRDDIGSLEVGKQADIACFKLDDMRFSGSHDPLAALLLCGAHQADAVMVQGQWRVRDGSIIDLDIKALISRHQQSANHLVNKVESV